MSEWFNVRRVGNCGPLHGENEGGGRRLDQDGGKMYTKLYKDP